MSERPILAINWKDSAIGATVGFGISTLGVNVPTCHFDDVDIRAYQIGSI